jgi:hypothetical protein
MQPIKVLVEHEALKLKDISSGGHVIPPIRPALSPFERGKDVITLCAGVKNTNTFIAVVGGSAVELIPILG